MGSAPAALLAVCLLCGCGAAPARPAPPAAPDITQPANIIPADLDLVLRVDLARVRSALGPEAQAALARLLESAPDDEPDFATRRLVLALLARTRTLWLGVRPSLAPELTDNVLVLRGDFLGLLPSSLGGSPPWQPARDLGGDVRRFERAKPPQRAAPAVLYTRGSDLVVLGSLAEVDALERTLEQGRGEPAVPVPEAGVVSLGARLEQLHSELRQTSPTLAQLLRGAERLEASADLKGGNVSLQLDFRFDEPERARAVAEALEAVRRALRGPIGKWLERARIEPLEHFVNIRLEAPEVELLRLLSCQSAAGCAEGGTVPGP